MKLDINQNAFLSITSDAINNTASFDAKKEDFEEIFKLADKHCVSALCLSVVEKFVKEFSSNLYFNWMYLVSRKLSENEKVINVQKKLTDLLENNNVEYFVFKGLCSAFYYHNPTLRELGDIDIYVDFEKFQFVEKILLNEGFMLVDKTEKKHWHFTLDNIDIELHHSFWDMPQNECSDNLNDFLDNCIKSRKIYTINDYSFYGPNPVLHSLILILHIINHLQRGGIGLRHICDFATFLNSADYNDNKQEIVELFKNGGIYKTASVISNICFELLGSRETLQCYDNEELSELLLEDIMSSGNFGRLNKHEYYGSSLFTFNQSTNGGFVKSLFSFCKIAWKPCDKYKILLPIAPFYVGIRYFFRMITGKRPKINPVKYTKKSIKRADIYRNLNFFKEETEIESCKKS